MPPVLAARLLSLVFYFVFLFFGARLLAMEVSSIPIYYVALSLLVFWPLSATRATLLSNDIPLYMAEAAAFYYIMRWRRDEIPANLALAILWNGIAIAFKYSGIIITPFLGYIFVIQCYKNRACIRQLLTKPVLICLCASLLLVVGTFARTYYHYRIANTISLPLIAPTMMLLPRNLIIQNHLLDFVIPHFNSYLTSPFLQNYGAPLEHHYFINYVLKTSLFGCAEWTSVLTAYLLIFLAFAMFIYIAYSFILIFMQELKYTYELLPFLLFTIISLAALICYRLMFPFSCNQDFRFIYPITIAIAVIYAKLLSWQREHSHIKTFWLGALLPVCFSATAIAFILLNAWG